MKKAHILGITVLTIWGFTLVVVSYHYFIRPILPEYINLLFVVVIASLFGVMSFLSMLNDSLDLPHKLFGKQVKLQTQILDENAISLYFHKNPPYNAVKVLYSGSEIAKDFEVRVVYSDASGKKQIKKEEEFFPEHDSQMIWKYDKYDFLKPNQVIYFRLPRKKTVPDGIVKVLVNFCGANSGIPVTVEKEFELEY